MLKRYKPTQPDGVNLTFELPNSYIGGSITLVINGQMLYSQDNVAHPYGYTLDENSKTFTFYVAPEADEFLYVLYDYSIELSFDNIDWTKKIRVFDFSTTTVKTDWKQEIAKNSWDMRPVKTDWDMSSKKIKWEQEITGVKFRYKIHFDL